MAVDRLDLEVFQGEIFGLLGPNGAGKTTTIRMICGLLRPTSGEVYVYGYRMPEQRREASRLIGYMTQHSSLYDDLTVYENLMLYASLYDVPRNERRQRVEEILEMFYLEEFREKLAGKLSGGTKQRLALAVSMVHKPRLLVLDEPTAGVDPHLRRTFWSYFRQLNSQGITILVTTHYMDEAENCDRLGLMYMGRLAAVETPQEIKRMAYGGDLVEVELLEPPPQPLEQLLPSVRWTLSQDVDGGVYRLILVVEDSGEGVLELSRGLEGLGLHVQSVRPLSVSLEDAFIALTGGER